MVLTAPPTSSKPSTVPTDWIKLMIELAALAARFALLPACSASAIASGVASADGPDVPAGAVGKMMPCVEGDGAASSRAKRRMAAMMVISEIATAPSQKKVFRSIDSPLYVLRHCTQGCVNKLDDFLTE